MTEGETAGRDESEVERADRKWDDMLQELRVMQTGAQLLAGFLLTLPFQRRFDDLDQVQTGLYLVLVLLAAITTALVLTPIAVHRTVSGQQVKPRLVRVAHRLLRAVVASLSLLIVGMTIFIFDLVVTRPWAVGVGLAISAVLVALLVLLPQRLVR